MQPVLLLGERGSGRTSLLNHVAWLLARETESRHSVIVSGELANNPSQLLGVLVARVQRLAEPAGARGRWIEDLRALSMPDGPFGQVAQPAILMELVDLLGERLAALERPVCLMVDGITPTVAHATFGSLRNELWALPGATWVVAGDSAAETLYLEPPADAFFERTVNLGPLTAADAAKLLRAHVPALTEPDIEQAIAVAAGNPRRLLRAAADIRAGIAPASPVADGLAEQATAVAGPLAGALVGYLAENGATSASDETMLRQIGASRQRASQLMHELESAGVLETIEQHEPGRRGRPARRFGLRTPP
jgi:energy-coupling factor transporter ATP-binding protein EcfA2